MTLAEDPRWQKLIGLGGLDPIAFDAPDAWPHGPRGTAKALDIGEDNLTAAYCTLAGHHFLRTQLILPIRGATQVFTFEAWGSVSEDTRKAVIGARTGGVPFEGAFAWLANALPGFAADEPVGCNLLPGRPGQLPRLFAQKGPLNEAQQSGIEFERLLAILSETGSDLPSKLG